MSATNKYSDTAVTDPTKVTYILQSGLDKGGGQAKTPSLSEEILQNPPPAAREARGKMQRGDQGKIDPPYAAREARGKTQRGDQGKN